MALDKRARLAALEAMKHKWDKLSEKSTFCSGVGRRVRWEDVTRKLTPKQRSRLADRWKAIEAKVEALKPLEKPRARKTSDDLIAPEVYVTDCGDLAWDYWDERDSLLMEHDAREFELAVDWLKRGRPGWNESPQT